jgi:hypothetical protein
MTSKLDKIKQLLVEKSAIKQLVFKNTKEVFANLKITVKNLSEQLANDIHDKAENVQVKYYEKNEFEIHLKFSGDTLVFMMHTNVFDFENGHYIRQLPYIKEDPMRSFCGMIQIYNFLADSLKYNREGDIGYLVGRIFINKDNNFFIEGKRPLSFMFSDLSANQINAEKLDQIVAEAMHYCLNFDLLAPPLEGFSYITLEQKNLMAHSSGMPTGKRLGFINQADSDNEA